MAVRTSMASLITRLRLMVGDPVVAGTPPTSTFTDQELQDALDARAVNVHQQMLIPVNTLQPSGYAWLDYYGSGGDWEDDEVLFDYRFATITPATADRLTGHWTFSASQVPPVRITGSQYDLYGAAVAVLEDWLAREVQFDFSTDGQSFSRSQKSAQRALLASEYRRKAQMPGPRLAGLAFDEARPW